MGAHGDWRVFDAPNAAAAVVAAKLLMQDARYEEGSDSYAGHIGIADGIRVHRTPKPVTEKRAHALLFDGLDGERLAEKWGPAVLHRGFLGGRSG